MKHIQTRPIKRIEAFRNSCPTSTSKPGNRGTSNPSDVYTFALSGGISSTSLLYALDRHIDGMVRKTGRTSYALRVVHVAIPPELRFENQSSLNDNEGSSLLDSYKAVFPRHDYYTVNLFHILEQPPLRSWLDDFLTSSTLSSPSSTLSLKERVYSLLAHKSLDATVRRDVTSLLLSKCLEYISLHPFSAQDPLRQTQKAVVLLGSSATRLAAQTLSEVAKGKSTNIVSLLSDKPTSSTLPTIVDETTTGDVEVICLFRDVLRKDLYSFATCAVLPPPSTLSPSVSSSKDTTDHHPGPERLLSSLIPPHQLSSISNNTDGTGKKFREIKTLSIDELCESYFSDIEASFPGIVSNVVRTVGKLSLDGQTTHGSGRVEFCSVCGSRFKDEGMERVCERCRKDFGIGVDTRI